MKKIILNVAILVAFGTNSMAAIAGNTGKTYAGVQYAIGSYKEDGFEELNPTAIIGRLGKYINDNFALEGRLGFGLQDDSLNIFGTDISMGLDSLVGVYGVGHVNLSDTSSVYGLIGITQATATVKAPAFGLSNSDSDSGLSFGVGANIGVGNNTALTIEYTQYLSTSNYDFNAIGFGVVFSF